MEMFGKLLFEAILVGFLFAVVMFITSRLYRTKTMGQYYFSVFLSGFILHLLMEMVGGNTSYCDYGRACIINR